MTENDRSFNVEQIRKLAEAELKAELLRTAIDEMKKKLRQKKWFHRLFPWRVVFIRRDV